MTLGDLLDQIRSNFLTRLARSRGEACTRPGIAVESEPVLRDANGSAVREGAWSLPCRVDILLLESSQVVDSVSVSTAKIVAFAPLELEWSGRLLVRLEPFAWDYCRVTLATPITDPTHFRAWFEHWFDSEDSRPEDGSGFKGVVHFMSDPETRNGATTLLMDFGSAPAEAFEQFLDAAVETGCAKIKFGQPVD